MVYGLPGNTLMIDRFYHWQRSWHKCSVKKAPLAWRFFGVSVFHSGIYCGNKRGINRKFIICQHLKRQEMILPLTYRQSGKREGNFSAAHNIFSDKKKPSKLCQSGARGIQTQRTPPPAMSFLLKIRFKVTEPGPAHTGHSRCPACRRRLRYRVRW